MPTRRVSLEEFAGLAGPLGSELTQAAVRGLRSAAMRLEGQVVEQIDTARPAPAVATGEMRGSVTTERVDDGAVVDVRAPHAVFVEEGARPHFPPIQPLIDWVRTKRIGGSQDAERIAWMVARKIARDGVAPRHFFRKAVDWLTKNAIVPQELVRELNKVEG